MSVWSRLKQFIPNRLYLHISRTLFPRYSRLTDSFEFFSSSRSLAHVYRRTDRIVSQNISTDSFNYRRHFLAQLSNCQNRSVTKIDSISNKFEFPDQWLFAGASNSFSSEIKSSLYRLFLTLKISNILLKLLWISVH